MLFTLFFLVLKTAFANSLSGEEIMIKVFNRNDGEDAYFKMEMVLIDKKGNQRKRQLEVFEKDYGEYNKTFLEFSEPADIAGTSFLSWENEGKDDTQYLYLPALGRGRRIVSSQKNLRFVNTDFTYEDMQRRRPEDDKHSFLREEHYNGYDCYVVESIPREKTSQYAKRINWVDKESFVILRTEFYGKKEKPIKEFVVKQLAKRQGIWTPLETVMKNLKQKHTTVMKVLEVKYNQGLKDEFFTLRHLERHR